MSTAGTGLVAAVIALASVTTIALSEAQDTGSTHRTPTVLFMCPRGAAKSVLASTYFRELAKQRGLNVRVESAGTEPADSVATDIAAHLERNGYAVPKAPPRKATAQDLASADVVVSIGCDLSDLPRPEGELIRWDEVPALSEDFARADEAIRKRVIDLVEELMKRGQ